MTSEPGRQLAAQIMIRAIEEELTNLLGAAGKDALDFHADPEKVAESPVEYEESLRRILGEEGASLVVMRLRDKICEISGKTPKPECDNIQHCLECIINSRLVQLSQQLPLSPAVKRQEW